MKIMDREETSVEAQLREVKLKELWTRHQKLISYLCVYGTWSPVYTFRWFWCVSQCWSWRDVYLFSKIRWILITSDSWKSVQGDWVSGRWNELTAQSDRRPVTSINALNFVNRGTMLTENPRLFLSAAASFSDNCWLKTLRRQRGSTNQQLYFTMNRRGERTGSQALWVKCSIQRKRTSVCIHY